MTDRNEADSWGAFLTRVTESAHASSQYRSHPTVEVLQSYVRRELRWNDELSARRMQALNEGERGDWGQIEVGIHVKTCTICARTIAQMQRARQAEESSTAIHPISWLCQHMRRRAHWVNRRALFTHAVGYATAGLLIIGAYFFLASTETPSLVLESGHGNGPDSRFSGELVLTILGGLWGAWGIFVFGFHAYQVFRNSRHRGR